MQGYRARIVCSCFWQSAAWLRKAATSYGCQRRGMSQDGLGCCCRSNDPGGCRGKSSGNWAWLLHYILAWFFTDTGDLHAFLPQPETSFFTCRLQLIYIYRRTMVWFGGAVIWFVVIYSSNVEKMINCCVGVGGNIINRKTDFNKTLWWLIITTWMPIAHVHIF